LKNIHALPGTTNHERKGQHIVHGKKSRLSDHDAGSKIHLSYNMVNAISEPAAPEQCAGIQKAVKLGGHKTKKDAVSKALIEYIQNLEQQKIISMFGTVEYDPEYDYKEQRRRS